MAKYLFSLAIFLYIQYVAAAQQLSFNAYTPAEGLIDTRVEKIYQDSRGVMYFLTRDGFSTFDGQRFQNFSQYQNKALSIVSDILEGKDGRMMIVSISGIYFLQNNTLQKDTALFTASYEPGAIYTTKTGEKIISANSGVTLYNNEKATPLKVTGEDGLKQPLIIDKGVLKDDLLIAIYSKPKTNRQYLLLYNWKQQKIITEMGFESGLGIQQYHSKIYVFKNQAWMELDNEELKSGKLIFHSLSFSHHIPAGEKVYTFFLDAQKKVWLMTSDKKLCVISMETNQSTCYTAADGLPEIVNVFFQDKENNYWFAIAGKGVYKLTQNRVEKFLFPSKKNNGIVQQYINKSPEGIISFRINNSLHIANEKNISEKKLNAKKEIVQAFIWNNKLWTLYKNGKLESEKGDTVQLVSFAQGTKAISLRVTFDKAGRLLVTGNYLSVVNKDLSFITTELPYFTDNIACDDYNNYWCFTRAGPILSYQLQNNQLIQLQSYKETDFSSRYVLQWNKDTFCIGTRSMGIVFVKINMKEYKRLGKIGAEKGITNNFVVDIIRINNHKILAASVGGLDVVHLNKPDTTVEQLFSRAGLFLGANSLNKLNDSTVLALTEAGEIYAVHLSSSAQRAFTPKLYFNSITVNGKDIDTISLKSYKYSQNNFRFTVSAPSFIDEKNIRFVFSLTGSGTNAVQNSRRADFEYTNLQPGEYTLNATAFFPGDEPVSKSIQYSFTIKKPFWKTLGFLTGAITLVSLGIFLFFKNLLQRKLSRQKIELEKQQAIAGERSRIAADMHDDLGAGVSTIKFLSQTAPYIPAEQQQQNNLKISMQADELVDKMNDIIWAMNEKNDTLDNLIFYTKAWATNYAEQHQLKPNITIPDNIPSTIIRGEKRQHIFMCIKEGIHNIIKHAEAKNIWLNIEIEKNKLHIMIRDDGKGFDTKKIFMGNGLSNMQKRIKALDAEIKTENNNGTVQQFKIPL